MESKAQLRRNYLAMRRFRNMEQEGLNVQRKLKEEYEKSKINHATTIYQKRLENYKMCLLATQMRNLDKEESKIKQKKKKRRVERSSSLVAIQNEQAKNIDREIDTLVAIPEDEFDESSKDNANDKTKGLFHKDNIDDLVQNFCSQIKPASGRGVKTDSAHIRREKSLNLFIAQRTPTETSKTGTISDSSPDKDKLGTSSEYRRESLESNCGVKFYLGSDGDAVVPKQNTNGEDQIESKPPHKHELSKDRSPNQNQDDSQNNISSISERQYDCKPKYNPITGIPLREIMGNVTNDDLLNGVKVKQCWVGDPEAINSIRRPIISKQERDLRKLVNRALVKKEHDSQKAEIAEGEKSTVTRKTPVEKPTENSQGNEVRNHSQIYFKLSESETPISIYSKTSTTKKTNETSMPKVVQKQVDFALETRGVRENSRPLSAPVPQQDEGMGTYYKLDMCGALRKTTQERDRIKSAPPQPRTSVSKLKSKSTKHASDQGEIYNLTNNTEISQTLDSEEMSKDQRIQNALRRQKASQKLRRSLTQPTFSSLQKSNPTSAPVNPVNYKEKRSVYRSQSSAASAPKLKKRVSSAPVFGSNQIQDTSTVTMTSINGFNGKSIAIPCAIDEEISLV